MLKLDSFTENQKRNYVIGAIILGILTIISLVAIFSDTLVDKPEENSTLFYTDEENPESGTDQIYFTLGSTKEEVVAAQGKPTNIIGTIWYYGASRVDFKDEKVVGYSDRKGILYIEMKPKASSGNKYFKLGLTKDEVLAIQGRPSNIVGPFWYYGSSKVEFKDDSVRTFSDRKGIFKVKPRPE